MAALLSHRGAVARKHKVKFHKTFLGEMYVHKVKIKFRASRKLLFDKRSFVTRIMHSPPKDIEKNSFHLHSGDAAPTNKVYHRLNGGPVLVLRRTLQILKEEK